MDILIIGEDSHLALALEIVLRERGYSVQCERSSEWKEGEWRHERPGLIINISTSHVEAELPGSTEKVEMKRPVDTDQLLSLAERSATTASIYPS